MQMAGGEHGFLQSNTRSRAGPHQNAGHLETPARLRVFPIGKRTRAQGGTSESQELPATATHIPKGPSGRARGGNLCQIKPPSPASLKLARQPTALPSQTLTKKLGDKSTTWQQSLSPFEVTQRAACSGGGASGATRELFNSPRMAP